MTPCFGKEIELTEGRWKRYKVGQLDIIILNTEGEWRCACIDGEISEDTDQGGLSELSSHLDWKRMDCDEGDSKFLLVPTFPDLPLIAKPRNELKLAPNGTAEFFAGIPYHLELKVSCSGVLTSFLLLPTQQLSKTWHGTQLRGDLCYSLKTRACRQFTEELFPPEDIICHITAKNKGSKSLTIDHIYLPVDNFAIYQNSERLWASSATIEIEDSDIEKGNLHISTPEGIESSNTTKLTPPKKASSKRVRLLRAFSSFIDTINK